ncbi:MAG TPA: sulfite exporter TauE/SafE family protein, partial [Burkholderiales bacterium]|nr:sulfite exporter TauE/SafE family protein [Burkholderiales bacterium]
APGIIAGTFGGAFLAGFLDLRVLSVIFTALIYSLATQMLLDRKPRATRPMPGVAGALFAAGAIGVISSLTATGGAALVVAYLVRREVSVHEAIGTAAAIGWPLAVFGATGYVVSGLRVGELPPYSLGYAYLPAVAAIATASMLMAPAGARLAHRTPGKRLKRIFAVVLFALATSMLLRFV